jgi:hypothetical protein
MSKKFIASLAVLGVCVLAVVLKHNEDIAEQRIAHCYEIQFSSALVGQAPSHHRTFSSEWDSTKQVVTLKYTPPAELHLPLQTFACKYEGEKVVAASIL